MLLAAGLVAGPLSAFLIARVLLPVYILFPLSGALAGGWRLPAGVAALCAAPGAVAAVALLGDDPLLLERSLRWMCALASGATMAFRLGSSRAASLIGRASGRVRSFGLLESLAMVTSLAGPCSRDVRRGFARARREGSGIIGSMESALSGMDISPGRAGREEPTAASPLGAASASLAWLLLVLSVSGLTG